MKFAAATPVSQLRQRPARAAVAFAYLAVVAGVVGWSSPKGIAASDAVQVAIHHPDSRTVRAEKNATPAHNAGASARGKQAAGKASCAECAIESMQQSTRPRVHRLAMRPDCLYPEQRLRLGRRFSKATASRCEKPCGCDRTNRSRRRTGDDSPPDRRPLPTAEADFRRVGAANGERRRPDRDHRERRARTAERLPHAPEPLKRNPHPDIVIEVTTMISN